MTRRDPNARLQHMLAHAIEAVDMLGDTNLDTLNESRMLQLALVRLTEIVGEAASRIPDAERAALPEVPWQDVVGMRNRLAHGYDSVDPKILYDTIRDDLPPLISILERHITQT